MNKAKLKSVARPPHPPPVVIWRVLQEAADTTAFAREGHKKVVPAVVTAVACKVVGGKTACTI